PAMGGRARVKPIARAALVPEPPGPARPPLESLDETQPVPTSSRWGDASKADLAAMADLAPAARPSPGRGFPLPVRTDRPPPASAGNRAETRMNEASSSDIELMSALAAVPAKKAAAS